MLDFTSPPFAIAGLLAAAGPVIVHLLNRRRHRVVTWGAMDFLREALQRQRKTLELRDIVLLALRMVALVLLGLGLSRPFWRGNSVGGPLLSVILMILLLSFAVAIAVAVVRRRASATVWCGVLGGLTAAVISAMTWRSPAASATFDTAAATATGAVHAILLIDNSRSMGVATAAGTALDRALAQARRFIDQLPTDSRISLIPLAGTLDVFPSDPFVGREEARRALEQIRLVDAAADVAAGLEQAEQAGRQTPDLPAQRIVIWSDLQAHEWSEIDWSAWSQRIPDVQIAPLVEQPSRNLAITSLVLEDGFAGAEYPARFLVRVTASESLSAPTAAEVLLSFDENSAGSQFVELAPGQTREVEFLQTFDVVGEPGRPNWVLATVELQPADPAADQLAADNRLSLAIPVVDAVPVVFVDQHGSAEDVTRNRVGETHALRHLLAPRMSGEESSRRTVQIQHVTPDEVTQTLLESARLVVVGGVESPEPLVGLLREYMLQGGPLVILAGGAFDPEQWQADAWRNGRGLLPAKLLPNPLGSLPESTTDLRPFFADFRTLQNDWFLVDGEDPDTLRGLFETLPFFQAVQFDVDQPAEAEPLEDAEPPKWWLWRSSSESGDTSVSAPHVQAAFTNDAPWMIEQRVGHGRMIWFASGVSSDWNLLRTSSAMYVFHRLMTRLMSDTLPVRNYEVGDRIVFPSPAADGQRFQLARPGGVTEALAAEAIDAEFTGLIIRRSLTAGAYRVTALPTQGLSDRHAATSSELLRFSVQPPASESELVTLSPDELRQDLDAAPFRVLNVNELPRVTGGAVRGQSLWRGLLSGMLLVLLGEMALASAVWRRRAA